MYNVALPAFSPSPLYSQIMNLFRSFSTIVCGFVSSFSAQGPLRVKSKAPDFELKTDSKGTFKLSDNFGRDGKTTIVVFSRAHWCPFCLKQLIELRRNAAKFEKANAQIVVVFRDESKGIDGLKKMKARSKVDFVFALDNDKAKTPFYSPGKLEFSSYVIDNHGTIQGIVKGDKKNRAKSQMLLDIIGSSSATMPATKADDRVLEPAAPSLASDSFITSA